MSWLWMPTSRAVPGANDASVESTAETTTSGKRSTPSRNRLRRATCSARRRVAVCGALVDNGREASARRPGATESHRSNPRSRHRQRREKMCPNVQIHLTMPLEYYTTDWTARRRFGLPAHVKSSSSSSTKGTLLLCNNRSETKGADAPAVTTDLA